ncbi:MAG: hypothetical protein ABSA59_00840 [Terriglobia bacterium]
MKKPALRGLRKFVAKGRSLKSYLQSPGDGRSDPRLPAAALLGVLLTGALLRPLTFAAMEARVRSAARRLPVSRRCGDDARGYFTEHLEAAVTRGAAVTAVHPAKRHKALDNGPLIGRALDGTGAGRSREKLGKLCRP